MMSRISIRAIQTISVTLLTTWVSPSHAQPFRIDQFSVAPSGGPSFVDSFDDDTPPPSGPLDPTLGAGATYTLVGSLPAGSESSGKLDMDPAVNGAPSFNGGVAIGTAVDLRFPSDSPFSINGLFDVPAPSGSWLLGVVAYEFVDVGSVPVYTGNIIYSLLGFGGGQYFEAAAQANSLLGIFALTSFTPIPAPVGNQIALSLTSAGSGSVDAAYQDYDGGQPVGSANTFYTYLTTNPRYEAGFTVGINSVVPEPGTALLLGLGLAGLARSRQTMRP